ncbi:YraN family protein [Gordonia sp. MP11Mi]|uniref:UPF0102 protein MP11Mi_36270 n=1 Tax=Gordonia sp. MP11Mi TaxID=3022769 RepID=A0AA97CXT2_9ACTN
MGEKTTRPDRRRQIGRLGEDVAAEYLASLGWEILARNWRTRYGELDVVAAIGGTLVIVEVKTRASRTFTDPVAAVTPQKLRTMRLVARQWLAEQERYWPIVRFDIVSIQLDIADPEDLERATLAHHTGVVE